MIAWYDNIPFISWVALKGKCRYCKAPISFKYFLVEFLTAAGFVVFFWQFGLTVQFFAYTTLFCLLVVATFIDFVHQIIPDEITIGGLVAGLLASLAFPQLHSVASYGMGLFYSALGALVGGGSIYLIGFLGSLAFKKEAMGGGDVKFMAMIGAILGWKLVLLIFFVAPFFGSIVGIIIKLRTKQDLIPYGPYLSLATVLCIFWGRNILQWLFW